MLRRAAINSPASALRSLVAPFTRSFHATVIARDPPNKPTSGDNPATTTAKDEEPAPSSSGRGLLGVSTGGPTRSSRGADLPSAVHHLRL